MKKNSFIFGAIVLGLSGIVCKILGAFYKIPLANILGSQGIGIYYLVFPVYAFLLTLTSASFTIVISKRVSKCVSIGENEKAHSTFVAAFFLLLILGVVASVLLVVFSKIIAGLQGVETSFVCYLVIAPAILFVAISSAFKGFFQGLQNMLPTATSQIFEQVIKLLIGFVLAKMLIKNSVVFGVFGALIGVTISEGLTSVYFVIWYLIFKKKNKEYRNFKFKIDKTIFKKEAKGILKESVPFTLSSIIMPMSLIIDSFLVINLLKTMNFNKVFATTLLGLNSGVVNTLVGLPSTISVAICVAIVPYIVFALNQKDYAAISQKVELALRLCAFVSLPCVFLFLFFSKDILLLLFSHSFSSVYELDVAANLLSISCINVLYLTFVQITTSLLQAVNRSYVPVISLSVSLLIKVFFEVVLISNPYLNIAGAVVSNCVCYFLSCCINIVFFKREVEIKFSVYKMAVCPLVASMVMCATIVVCKQIFVNLAFLPQFLVCYLLGAVAFLAAMAALKCFSKEEMGLLFKTRKNFKKQAE